VVERGDPLRARLLLGFCDRLAIALAPRVRGVPIEGDWTRTSTGNGFGHEPGSWPVP
jgi:hypothetical protein